MTPADNTPDELDLLRRTTPDYDSEVDAQDAAVEPSRLPRNLAIGFIAVLVLLVVSFYSARIWARHAMRDSLPQLDGSIAIPGLSAPVTVQRDSHGVPSIRAASLDDLILAQGYVTAQDRLWQMETLRRHASGNLAELFGAKALPHDRTQRTLQLRAAADRAIAVLPPDQLHWLELYARGVNASIANQRPHLPLEFRLLGFEPAPWTPRDSLLISVAMFQDLTTTFPTKLSREAITTRLPSELVADLYPVGSWRDHPPAQPPIDLTTPQENIPNVPLDESQTRLTQPSTNKPGVSTEVNSTSVPALIALQQSLTSQPHCESCLAGSNNWAVSGAHTASGKPLLSNDMHLTHGVPGIWYETTLYSPTPSGTPFHVAGVALPGTPFIVVGHNDHIAWSFTNTGADVQEIYVEHTRATPQGAEFQSPDGSWQPVQHHPEIIHVRGSKDVTFDVLATQHGNLETPIISPLLNAASPNRRAPRGAPEEPRALALAWTIYDPANVNSPFFNVNSATDWTSLTAAFSIWGGPTENMIYADDQGHIGFHAVGKIPIRGSVALPSPLSPVPVSGLDPNQQWAGYIPFEQLPQIFDPPSGILATANARITPDLYPFPISLDWMEPYRNERIWKVLSASSKMTPADMLKLQTDVYSDVDHALAQRFAYAIDHAGPHTSTNPKRLHQAADLLRNWNGNVDTDSPAANIVEAARAALWPMLLTPKLKIPAVEAVLLYTWGEKIYAEEQIILHAPARWLPNKDIKWDDLLAAAVDNGLTEAHAPQDLSQWPYGKTHVVDIEHPVFSLSPLIDRILGVPTGTGVQPQSGDKTTVKQVGLTFGPSERLTVDFSDLDSTTLNLVLGESGDPLSPWFMDQFPAWYHGTTNQLPYSSAAVQSDTTHTLTLTPP
jgi:penicillin G amidase